MSKCDKLLKQAQNSPNSFRFEDLLALAECHGFVFERQVGGSHRIYKHNKRKGLMNFQDNNGKAKGYQVKQLLVAIAELRTFEKETED
jgi:hypothetical protein